MRYYIAENGQPAGPFEPSELLLHGLTANSLVWGEGMPNWTSASQVPELMSLITGQSSIPSNTGPQMPQMPPMGNQPPMPQMPIPQMPTPEPSTPVGQSAPTSQPNNPFPFPQGGSTINKPNQGQAAPKTWLLESILATAACSLCCGVPFIGLIPGFVAIYMAWSSKSCYAKGDIDGANKKSASAKKWMLITLVVGIAASVFGAFQTISSNPNIIEDIKKGNVGLFYGIQ